MHIAPLTISTRDGVDDHALRRRAEADGYLFLPALADPDSVLALRRRAVMACVDLGWLDPDRDPMEGTVRRGERGFGWRDPRFADLQRRLLPTPEWSRLRNDPGLHAVLTELFGGPAQSTGGDVSRIVFPEAPEHTTMPHQDQFYVGGPADTWTVWVPLGDCPITLGPLAVLPGSHRHGLRPHAALDDPRPGLLIPDDVRWTTGDMQTGDVLMFSGLTVHRACVNHSSTRLRLSADFRFRPASIGSRATDRASG